MYTCVDTVYIILNITKICASKICQWEHILYASICICLGDTIKLHDLFKFKATEDRRSKGLLHSFI